MLSDEEKEIFNNLKEYMQSKINKGYHKFIYNDLDWDFKCIDCINAIDKVLKQSKEIEELKEKNKTLKSLQNDTNGLYIEMTERKNYFERELQKVEDKIKAKIEEVKDGIYDAKIVLQSLLDKE